MPHIAEGYKAPRLQVRAKIEAAVVPLPKYIIRKQLTKRIEDYPDAAAQPHVQAGT